MNADTVPGLQLERYEKHFKQTHSRISISSDTSQAIDGKKEAITINLGCICKDRVRAERGVVIFSTTRKGCQRYYHPKCTHALLGEYFGA